MISAFRRKSKFEFRTFLKKKNPIFGFPWRSTREDLSLDVSITNVGLILTKLRWFQLFVKSQISNFKLFWKKKIKFLVFHGVVLVKTFPLMYQLLIKDWYWRSYDDFFSRGADRQTDGRTNRQTDRYGFGILTWKHVGTQKISTQNSKLVVSRRSLYASPEVGDA